MSNDLLVTIFTHNRPDYLYGLLESLRHQTFKKFDLLIVDDASNTPIEQSHLFQCMQKLIWRDGNKLTLYRFEKRMGIAKSRATLLKMGYFDGYEFVMDLNDDHILEKDVIYLLHNVLKNNEGVGAACSATPMAFWPNSVIDPSRDYKYVYKAWADWEATGGNFLYAWKDGDQKGIHMKRYVDYIYLTEDGNRVKTPAVIPHGSQFMYRPGALEKGELPENYSYLSFTEETDLSLRILKSGYKIVFVPNAINWHMQGQEGGIRNVGTVDRMEFYKHDQGVFIDNWWEWLWNNDYRGEKP